MKKHFFRVDPNDPDDVKDVAHRMFAALKKDMARNKVLDQMNQDMPAHPRADYARHLQEMDRVRAKKQ